MLKKMFKWFIIVFIIVVICFIVLIPYDHMKKNKYNIDSITIGVIPNIKPYCYKNDSDTLTGFNIDAVTSMGLELGVSIEWYEMSEDDTTENLLMQNKVDCFLGTDIVHDQNLNMVRSRSFSENKISIFIKKYDAKINSFEDLKYKKVSVYRNDPVVKNIDNIEGIRVFKTDNIEAAVSLMMNGMAEAYIGDKFASMDYIYNSDFKNSIKLIGDDDCNWISSILIPQKNKDLITIIEQGLVSIEKHGILEKVRIKWFGQSVNQTGLFFKKTIIVAILISSAIGLVLVVFYRINNLLRKEVKERTQKINEEKILKEEIINSLFDGVLFIDIDGNIILENKAAQIILREEESLIGKNLYQIRQSGYFDLEDFKYAIANKQKLIQKEIMIIQNEEKRHIKYNITPVFSENTKLHGVTLNFTDTTEEKKMMEKLITKDKMESLGRLTAGIAHEIRNPLTSIDLYVKLLPEKIDNKSFRMQILEDIPKEIKRLNNILKNLLDYAKPITSQREIFDINIEINFVLRLLFTQIENKKIKMGILEDESIKIFFDKQQFKQILINIILNSIDALENIKDGVISIKYKKGNDNVIIEIVDNGLGISKDVKNHIFEPFFSTKSNSYGLGLAIVAQLVKENESEIYVDDNCGIGTKMILKIPFLPLI